MVTRSQSTPFTSAVDGSAVDGLQFYLNCNGGRRLGDDAGQLAGQPGGP